MKVQYLALFALFFAVCSPAEELRPVPAPPLIGATSYFMIDSKTGRELASLKPDTPVPPASLTKLMTAYVVFNAIKDKQIRLDEEVTISEKAWRTPG